MTPLDLRPEHQLLLMAARTRVGDGERTRLRELAVRDLDWNVVASHAALHGVAPLVFHTLTTAGGMDPADERIAGLWRRFVVNAGNSLVLGRQLVEVVAILQHERIPVVAYKGPVLAAALYGNLSLREFTDLDVLVHRHDAERAGEALVQHGYEPEVPLSPAEADALVRSRAGYFRRFDRLIEAGRVVLELHWRIPATFDLDDGFWGRLGQVRLLDRDLQHFAVEDLLLILSAHGFKHGWSRLKWLCDVAELVNACPNLDWDRAIARASRAGGLRILLLGCALAGTMLSTPLPRPIVERISVDAAVGHLAALFSGRLLDNRPSHHVGIFNNLRVRERMHDRVRYGLALLDALTAPTVKDRMEWPVHGGARLVARLTHPFRVMRRVADRHRA